MIVRISMFELSWYDDNIDDSSEDDILIIRVLRMVPVFMYYSSAR